MDGNFFYYINTNANNILFKKKKKKEIDIVKAHIMNDKQKKN